MDEVVGALSLWFRRLDRDDDSFTSVDDLFRRAAWRRLLLVPSVRSDVRSAPCRLEDGGGDAGYECSPSSEKRDESELTSSYSTSGLVATTGRSESRVACFLRWDRWLFLCLRFLLCDECLDLLLTLWLSSGVRAFSLALVRERDDRSSDPLMAFR